MPASALTSRPKKQNMKLCLRFEKRGCRIPCPPPARRKLRVVDALPSWNAAGDDVQNLEPKPWLSFAHLSIDPPLPCLQIGVPADWDVKSMVYRTSSAGATGDVKTPASRRTWGRQASGGGGSSSSSSSSAGSWIRSVFSASSSSSDGGGGKKGRGGGAAGGGAGDETSGTVSASSDGIAATTTTGTLGGVTSTKSPLPERKLEVGEVLLGVVPACSDRHRRQNATVSAGEDCMGQDSALGRGTAPILHASAADRLAPQVLRKNCVIRSNVFSK